MVKYLLDTNVVLRFSNPSDEQHRLATESVATLLSQADECYLTAQVLIEFWVVATRPVAVNGLEWSVEQTRNIIEQLLERFPVAEETPRILPAWLAIVNRNQVKGKRTHDARIAALMVASDISHILTFNPSDFTRIPGITVAHPQEIIATDVSSEAE
jgi:predicted nucleic acid-binding protein